jgi:hypothetical protein
LPAAATVALLRELLVSPLRRERRDLGDLDDR